MTKYICINRFIWSLVFLFSFWIMARTQAQNAKTQRNFSIEIQPMFGTQPLVLGTQKYITPQKDTVQIDLFRCYLSGFELEFENGVKHKIKDYYHLLDAEEKSTLNLTFRGIPQGKIKTVHFQIGVDSQKSVSGAQGGDLDPAKGMYWAWNSGYIYAKLEGRSKSCPTHRNAFEFHIGGYAHPQNALRKTSVIVYPNASGQSAEKITLQADVSCWFEGVRLQETHGIMIPGKQALQMADRYKKMFTLNGENK